MNEWTPHDETELRRLMAEGKSSLAISRVMKRSRNSICGRARRMGLRFRACAKPELEWVTEARRLIADGQSIRSAAKALSKSESALRIAMDINGAKGKAMEASRLAKARERARLEEGYETSYVSRVAQRIARATLNEKRSVENAYDKPEPRLRTITLPVISLPKIEEEPRTFRLVPKVECSINEGAERIRRIHLAMQRRGTFRSVEPVAEVRI